MLSFTLPWPILIGFIVATVLPLLVGLVTTRVTSPGARAVLLAALSAATGLLSELGAALTNGTAYNVGTGGIAALAVFLVAVGIHFGLWKPTGAAAAAQAVGSNTRVDGGHSIR